MKSLFLTLLAILITPSLLAQSFLGTWQGTMHAGETNLRVVVEIVQPRGSSAPIAHIYTPDQNPEGMHADSLTLTGSHLHLTLASFNISYDATLSADGQTLDGSLTQGSQSPLKLIRATGAALWIDPHLHGSSSLVTVAPGVQLEVVDWGGSGRSIVLLSGLGNTAHIFDRFAQKLTLQFHVIGVTRRGFGDSSIPSTANAANYTADRLGDDVLSVIAALHLNRPVLIGHSIAGEELSSVASRHPEAISALVYLDAGFPYAFYDPTVGDFTLDLLDLQHRVATLLPGINDPSPARTITNIEALLPRIQKDLTDRRAMLAYMPPPPSSNQPDASHPLSPGDAITLGEREYTHIPSPTLAIFAVPHDLRPIIPNDPKALADAETADEKHMSALADSFGRGVANAHVVRLANASHYVFLSNEADVLREIHAFLPANP